MTDDRKQREKPSALYPWLRRDYFKTSVSYLISLGVHALIFFFLLATIVMDGGGGPGDGYGGKGELFSTLVGHGELDSQTDRTDESKSLQEEIAKAVEQVEPLPEVASEVTPELSDVGVTLSTAPKINPIGVTSSLRNMPPPSTGGGMALGPGIGAQGGLGGGIGRGFGRGFGDFIGLMQKWGFDVVFVVDGTNSMEFVINEVKARLADLVGHIQKLVPNARVGMVIYKDKGEEFVARKSDLTFHFEKLQAFIRQIQASGGGDYEEAVMEGLRTAAQDIGWRKFAHRAIVLVPSSPPREAEKAKLHELVRSFHGQNGVVHVLDLSDVMHRNYEREFEKKMYNRDVTEFTPLPQFYREMQALYTSIAKEGGGELLALSEGQAITEQLMIAAFGSKWQKEVSKFTSGG